MEDKFGPYISEVARQFGYTGVTHDPQRNAFVFPAQSQNPELVPETLRGQPSSFFATIAGAATLKTPNFILEPGEQGTVMRLSPTAADVQADVKNNHDRQLKKLRAIHQRPLDAERFHRELVRDYEDFASKRGLPIKSKSHLPADHTRRSPDAIASGETPSKTDNTPNR